VEIETREGGGSLRSSPRKGLGHPILSSQDRGAATSRLAPRPLQLCVHVYARHTSSSKAVGCRFREPQQQAYDIALLRLPRLQVCKNPKCKEQRQRARRASSRSTILTPRSRPRLGWGPGVAALSTTSTETYPIMEASSVEVRCLPIPLPMGLNLDKLQPSKNSLSQNDINAKSWRLDQNEAACLTKQKHHHYIRGDERVLKYE